MTTTDRLVDVLEREHREVDAAIEASLTARGQDGGDPAPLPLLDAMESLRRHIYVEEAFLFPPMQDAGLFAPLLVMRREHGEIWNTMDAIAADLASRPGSGPSGKLCRELLGQLERHNSKEELVIYPQVDEILGAETGLELRAFLTTGRRPAGWVCQDAGG